MTQIFKNILPQKQKNVLHLLRATLAIKLYNNPSKNLQIIAVTGTDGKTTTATFIYHILKSSGKKVALISTVGAYIGNQQIDTGFHVTSPNPLKLQKLLRTIVNKGYQTAIIEATSHGLDQHRLHGISPQIAILTNITPEHLDYHRDFASYVKTKQKLFRNTKIAILNRQDPSYHQIRNSLRKNTKLVPYDLNTPNTTLTTIIKKHFKQNYNQLNAIAAATASQQLGISDAHIAQAITSAPQIAGRMEEIKNNRGIKVIVDFAHTPNALENVLLSLKKSTKGRLIAVYGSAGLRDKKKRPQMGKIGSSIANEVILTAEDPRTESVWAILDEISRGITTNIGHVFKIPDRQHAINFAVKLANRGDTIAILGKGHEKSMCFGTIERPWSDQTAAKKALNSIK